MPAPAAFLAAAYLCLLGPGQAWLPPGPLGSRRLLTQIALSALCTSTIGLALAALGAFSLGRVLGGAALVTAAGLARALTLRGLPTLHRPHRPSLESAAGPMVALAALLLFWPPYETHIAGTDSTGYVAAGIQLARSGSLSREDRIAAELPLLQRRVLFRPALDRPGQPPFHRQVGSMNLAALDATVARPNFFPVPMIWAAIFSDVLGPRHAGGYAALFCALSLWAVQAFAARRVGTFGSVVAAAVVGSSIAGYWAGRFALSEPLTWFMLWTGLVSLDAWEEGDDGTDAALAGTMLGAAGLVRLDYTLFVAAALALRHLFGRTVGSRPLPPAFYAGFGVLAALTAVEIVAIPGGYSLPITNAFDSIVHQLGALRAQGALQLALAGAAALVGFALALRWVGVVRASLGAGVIGFVAAYVLSSREQVALSYSWISACLGTPALLLAAAGLGALLWPGRQRHPGNGFFCILVVLTGTLLLYDPHVQPIMLWGLRRFVPLVIPALAVAGAFAAATVAARSRALGAVAWTVLAASILLPARGLWLAELYAGAHDQLARLERILPREAIVLIDRPIVSYMLGTGLWLIHDRESIPVDTTSTSGRAALPGLVSRLGRDGRRVLLLQPATQRPPKLRLVRTRPVTTHEIALLFPDHPRVDAPIRTREYTVRIVVTELIPYRGPGAPDA